MGSKFFKADYDTATHRRCGVHGVMPIEGNFYACNSKSRHGKETVIYRCSHCQKTKRADRYKADPQKSHNQVFAWRLANPEAAKVITNRCYEKNKEKYLLRYKQKRLERRLFVLRHYSGGDSHCALCLETHHEFLVIDHPDGGGNLHRESLGDKYRGDKFYKWLIDKGLPPDYRVLCHNCNFKEHFRRNREFFEAKVWNETNLLGSRVIDGKEYPVDRRKQAIQDTKDNARVKLACLVLYSGPIPECACCHATDVEVLSIDHLDGGGRKHRREVGNGHDFYQWILKNPGDYRVLCHNCNFSYGLYGDCPHQENDMHKAPADPTRNMGVIA